MNKKYFLQVGCCLLFTSITASAGLAQETPVTRERTTTVRETIKNSDGTYSVIEYPVGKEVVVDLTSTDMPSAKGTARVMRMGSETTVNLDLSGLATDATSNYYVYAVDPTGAVTLLGPLNTSNGAGTLSVKTPMDKFMLVLSPEEGLNTIGSTTRVAFRSTVPTGYAVVTAGKSQDQKQVAATVETKAYNAPLLGIPNIKGDTEIRVKFTGELQGLKGKAYINPRKDGATQIKMRFDDMKLAPKGDRRFVLWAVGADNKITKLGQVINTGERQEAEIRSETLLKDFGLFVTMEERDVEQPTGLIMTTFGS